MAGKGEMTRLERLQIANMMIRVISENGRQFFAYGERVSHFWIDPTSNRLWFIDAYRQSRIYVAWRRGRWYGFSEGGTLRALVENLADYITKDSPIREQFGPWPKWVCDGDLWGYGDSMVTVRNEIHRITNEPELALRNEAEV